jgi:hypothetical protein
MEYDQFGGQLDLLLIVLSSAKGNGKKQNNPHDEELTRSLHIRPNHSSSSRRFGKISAVLMISRISTYSF